MSGGVSGNWVLTRSDDADTGVELVGAFVFVEEGNNNSNTGWVQSTVPPITMDTSPINWTQFSGAGTYLAGNGLTLSGNTFSVNTSNKANVSGHSTKTTGFLSDKVVVISSGVNYQVLTSNGSGSTEAVWGAINLSSSQAVTSVLSTANGGTGSTSFLANSRPHRQWK